MSRVRARRVKAQDGFHDVEIYIQPDGQTVLRMDPALVPVLMNDLRLCLRGQDLFGDHEEKTA